ncbi:MAG TPA: peptide ABC transporter substrate-binding protein, partial [Candidatus Didemnitutus sp.]|nr:peptide ABC transporter substrate-binding protein [Candidatus Didemnitutus sp.]
MAVAALAGAAAWTLGRPGGSAAFPNQVLTIAAVTRIHSLHPHEQIPGSTLMRARLIQALWDGLVELDPQTLTPRPAVAESWEIAADNRSAIFHLAHGVSWSNGDPLIADDFVFALRQALNTPSAAGDALLILKNARAYREGRVTDVREVGVKALDARTLRLDLEHPVPGLLTELCDVAWLPLHPGSYELLRSRTFLQEPKRLVTNGAFKLESITPDKLTLSPNPYYYARSQVHLAGIELLYTEDISLYPQLLESGEVQLCDRLNSGNIKPPTSPDIELWRDPTLVGGYVHFNLRRGPLADVRVRRALSLALDREALVRTISPADLRAAHTCLPPLADGENIPTVHEDLAEARRLLAEAGYPGGRNFPVLNWPYRSATIDAAVKVPEECAAQWRERLGIPIYLVLMDDEEFQARVQRRDYDLA